MPPDPLLAASPPVLVTLFTGLLIAFAVQLLMTTFGVAAGVTALGFLPGGQSAETEAEDEAAKTSAGAAGKIGFAIGAGTLLTVNAVLFTACFLAVKLSVVSSVTLGAVLGVVIWSGYFLVLTWLSSKAAGSLLGVLVGAVNAGVQGLMTTVTTALGRKERGSHPAATLPEGVNKRIAATETNLATLQEQLDTNHRNLETTLQEYVQSLQPPKPDLQSIRQEVAAVLASAGLPSIAKTSAKTGLSRIDRQAFVDLVSSRTDFSKRDIADIVEQLEGVWQEVVGAPDPIADITTFFQTASPEALTPATVNDRLHQLLSKAQPHQATGEFTAQSIASPIVSPLEPKQLVKQLVRTVRDRVDLSDLDVGSILQQLQALMASSDSSESPESSGSAAVDRADPLTTPFTTPFTTTIKADVEDYLLNAYPWHLTRKTVQAEFTDVIYDPDANPIAVKQQLLALDREWFVALLEQRGDLSEAKVKTVADRLEAVRQEVLQMLDQLIADAPSQAFSQQVAAGLKAIPKAELQPDQFQQQLQTHLQKVSVEQWSERLKYLNRDRMAAMLDDRPDLSPTERETLVTQFEAVRDRLLSDLQRQVSDAKAEAVALWQQLGAFVGDREQKLTARTIQRQLKMLTKASKTELASVCKYLPSFDRARIEQWLSERQDMTEKQRKRLLPQLEKAWNDLCKDSPPADQSGGDSPVLTVLLDYVQHLDPATFSLTNLPQALLQHLQQQQVGADALSQLTATDWKPLFELVQQRSDLTPEQQHQLRHYLQRSLYTLGKLPRRLALRSQRQVQNWHDQLIDYLRHADRDDLSLDRASQLMQHLLNSAPTTPGDATWLDGQLPAMSRDNLVALLSKRGDMTATDINEIVERVEAATQQAIAQAQTLQQQAQETLTTTFDKLRHYLAALPLPELDYDRLKDELQQVFVDPRAGLENLSSTLGDTLRDQLSTLNRDSLTALINTRDDLSHVFTEQVIDRIDAVRLSALNQIETMQQGAQRRLEDLKQQAQQQAEDTRKAVAIAAWWLFLTAFSSALSAAIAGALAVGGIQWFKQWFAF